MKHYKKYKPYYVGLLTALVAFLIWIIAKNKTKPKGIYSVLEGSKYEPMAKLIEAQAKHETGNYTSRAFKENNNLFGMKNAIRREQLGFPKFQDMYRLYESPEQSVKDLMIYFDFVKFPVVTDPEAFVRNLKQRSYFEDNFNNYLNGVKSFLS